MSKRIEKDGLSKLLILLLAGSASMNKTHLWFKICLIFCLACGHCDIQKFE